MKETEIIAGNRLIAEFMYDKNMDSIFHDLKPNECIYHSSWDWIVPVVEKISRTINKSTFDSKELYRGFRQVNIELVWSEVIKFIKWHNNQPHEREK